MRSPSPHPGLHHEASSTDTASPEFTPSPRSSHSSSSSSRQIPGAGDAEAYELRVLTPRGRSPARDSRDENAALRGARRLSFDSVQSYELYTPDEEKAVLRKLDRRLVAFMALLYCLSFLDRSSESLPFSVVVEKMHGDTVWLPLRDVG
jgi:hypothetical protein